ncbi:MAG: hypothetical protein KDA05_07025 [Phycisphaerales bacterium]|nr:hypothetical protein [Phycisphaerales bacterium]
MTQHGAPPKGNHLVTDAPPPDALASAQEAAQLLGFRLHPTSDWSFQAGKGNLAASVFVGAFVAYCDFGVSISTVPDGNTAVTIARNAPWWTGIIGVKRVQGKADELGNAVGQALVNRRFNVLSHARG